jgi:hypothetical protein
MARRKQAGRAAPRTPERSRTVDAGAFRLVDRAGRVRAVLEMGRAGPCLSMMHDDGTVALELVLSAAGPRLRLTDERGVTRVFVGATRGAARMGMADAAGQQRLFLGLSNGGRPALTLYDGAQRQAWTTGDGRARRRSKT